MKLGAANEGSVPLLAIKLLALADISRLLSSEKAELWSFLYGFAIL